METLVDNEIAVENLKKMADQKGYKTTSEKLEEGKYRVCIIVENVVDNVEKKKETVENSVTVRRKREQ